MTFRKNQDVISRREGNKTLVFYQKSGQVYILNPTSTFIWEHCSGEQTAEEIVELLGGHFEIPEPYADQLPDLVTRHLDLLTKAHLLESVAA